MVAKILGILPNCFVSPSKVSRTPGAAFSFTSGLTTAMRHLLICEGITWSQEAIPNTAQLGTNTGIPTSLPNSPRQRTKDGRQAGGNSASRGCREEMGALPDSACLQALFLGVSVTHGDESDQRCAEHQFRIAILDTAGRGPAEHPHRHHLGNRSSYGRQAEGINREAIAVLLDRIPFRADPTFAAMLDIGIGIDFRICDRTHLGNLFSIGFSRDVN